MTTYYVGDSIPYAAVASTYGFSAESHDYYWTFDDGATAGTQTAAKAWATPGIHDAVVRAIQPATGGVAYDEQSVVIGGGAAAPNHMLTARASHESILLNNGKVLIVGGFGSVGYANALTSCELYDPTTQQFSVTGSLNHARASGFKLVTLPSGDIMAVGGKTAITGNNVWYETGVCGSMTSCEVYSVANGTWSNTGSMTYPRYNMTATAFPSGKIIVVGGAADESVMYDSSEIYDPTLGTWSAGPTCPIVLVAHAAATMPDGKIFFFGGGNDFNTEKRTYELAEGGSFVYLGDCLSVTGGRSLYFPAWSIVGNIMYVTPGLGRSTSAGPEAAFTYNITGNSWAKDAGAGILSYWGPAGWCATPTGVFVYLGYAATPQVYNGTTVTMNATALSCGFSASVCRYDSIHVLVTGGSSDYAAAPTNQSYIYVVA